MAMTDRIDHAARDFTQHAEAWAMNHTNSRVFVETLINPPEPNGALMRAAHLARASRLFGDDPTFKVGKHHDR